MSVIARPNCPFEVYSYDSKPDYCCEAIFLETGARVCKAIVPLGTRYLTVKVRVFEPHGFITPARVIVSCVDIDCRYRGGNMVEGLAGYKDVEITIGFREDEFSSEGTHFFFFYTEALYPGKLIYRCGWSILIVEFSSRASTVKFVPISEKGSLLDLLKRYCIPALLGLFVLLLLLARDEHTKAKLSI